MKAVKTIRIVLPVLVAVLLCGCVALPKWSASSETLEAEYEPYLIGGTCSLTGQAFFTQQGGGVVKAAGRTVTLDPATSIGNEWWGKAGKVWAHRALTPPSPGFAKARRTTIADAEGRFKFADLAPGEYYVRTEVTWLVSDTLFPNQGGLTGKLVEIKPGPAVEVVLSQFPQ